MSYQDRPTLTASPTLAPSQPIHLATDLTQGGRLAQIQLGDQLYTLRITKAEKLILTK